MTTSTSFPAEPCRATVLCVDDDPLVLDALGRMLYDRYDTVAATSADEALAQLTTDPGRFAVIMSDLRMPGADGIELLTEAHRVSPDATRVLLTGFADLESATRAVNDGNIFRLLCKPIDDEHLISALDAAIELNRLVTAEKELLEQTLHGSVAALVEAMSLASPKSFARAGRLQRIMGELTAELEVTSWEIDVAAMLSQIGTILLPRELSTKTARGAALSAKEQAMLDRLPEYTESLLANIPRLDEVRAIIRYQHHRFDGLGAPEGDPRGQDLPLGARMLKIAGDLDTLESRRGTRPAAIDVLRSRVGVYDVNLLALLSPDMSAVVELDVADLQPGMVIEKSVRGRNGCLLLGHGHMVTPRLLNVLAVYAARDQIPRQVSVSLRPKRRGST